MNCEVCKKELQIGRQKRFCSKTCQHMGLSGDKNHFFKGAKLSSVCSVCGVFFEYFKGSSIGKYCSNECCLKSPEWREKNRLNKTGKSRSESAKLKQSLSTKGVSKSDAHRKSISIATIRRYDKIGRKDMGVLQAIRLSPKYEAWRKAVYKRDNYTCVKCGDKTGGNLEADHEIPLSYLIIEATLLGTNSIFDVDNGRTLCNSCHRKTKTFGRHTKHGKEYKMLETILNGYIKQENTGMDFDTYYGNKMDAAIESVKSKLES